ncbi:MAG: helix-turn-helix transcriptional regulator [Bacteroidetes bacterium]|nr:helix-turn-helix transcriptional regulator [Bacteroidota bacterium]
MIKTDITDPAIVRMLGNAIKQMRLRRNMSQDMIAEKSGLDRATISRIENGSTVTVLTLVQILRALDQLAVLDAFVQENEISPLQELKKQLKQKARERSRKKIIGKK